jgi:hypothetical protein
MQSNPSALLADEPQLRSWQCDPAHLAVGQFDRSHLNSSFIDLATAEFLTILFAAGITHGFVWVALKSKSTVQNYRSAYQCHKKTD